MLLFHLKWTMVDLPLEMNDTKESNGIREDVIGEF